MLEYITISIPWEQSWDIGNVWCTPWTNTLTAYMFFINGVTLLGIEIYTCEHVCIYIYAPTCKNLYKFHFQSSELYKQLEHRQNTSVNANYGNISNKMSNKY